MRRLARGLLHDDDLAADAVQDTFARLWQQRSRLGRMESPQGFCLTSLRNRCIDLLRREHRYTALDSVDADALPDKDEIQSTEAIDEDKSLYQRLEEALPQLTPRQQQLIRLRYVEQRSSREIAQRMGLTEGNVNTILSRTYAELRERLSEEKPKVKPATPLQD